MGSWFVILQSGIYLVVPPICSCKSFVVQLCQEYIRILPDFFNIYTSISKLIIRRYSLR